VRKPKVHDVIFFFSCLFIALAINRYVEGENLSDVVIYLGISIILSYSIILTGENNE
jgi:hypothetical protein